MRSTHFLMAALAVSALCACSEDSPMSGGTAMQKTPSSYTRIDRMGMPAVAGSPFNWRVT